jgi:hypothetical protein
VISRAPTVADRGVSSIAAISPKTSPGPIVIKTKKFALARQPRPWKLRASDRFRLPYCELHHRRSVRAITDVPPSGLYS